MKTRSRLIGGIAFALSALIVSGCGSPTKPIGANPRSALAAGHLDQLSEPCMKQIYIDCSREAGAGRLSFGEIAACSEVYETLLQRHFSGDFLRFLAWSRLYPDDAPAPPEGDEACPALHTESFR